MASLSESLQNCFENNISDDEYDDNDDDIEPDTFHNKSDSNGDATSGLDWDLFSNSGSSFGKSSLYHTSEHFAHDVNGKTDHTFIETTNSASANGNYKSEPFPFSLKGTPAGHFTILHTRHSQSDSERTEREVLKTVDLNSTTENQRPKSYEHGETFEKNFIQPSHNTSMVSAEIPCTPKRTNKNAHNPDIMIPSTEMTKAKEWVLTTEDLKGLSAYTGRASHAKPNRQVVSCQGCIPSDATDFKLPPITGTFKIRPKIKNKMTGMFTGMPSFNMANVANSNETDNDALLAHLTSAGMPEYIPCMQCYGSSGASGGSSIGEWNQDEHINGKCQRCGGTLLSSLDAVRALRNLQTIFQRDNLIVQDVRNDGNCLFAALVDQLRTQGNAEHDIYSLRAASVEYLRTHPYADDGSRLDAFLVGETWDQYLLRMGETGEWGDHMILNAISEVLHMRIVIYGGIADQRITTIVPKSCSSTEIKGDVRIAHLVEMHYISLRRRDWLKELDSQHEKHYVDLVGSTTGNGIFPVSHLDMMLKIIIQSDYLQSFKQSLARFLKPPYKKLEEASIHLVGDFISEAIPTAYSGTAFQSMPLINLLLRSGHQFKEKMMPILYIPHDTKAVFDNEQSSRKDLVVYGDPSRGPVMMIPVQPSLWKWRLDNTQSSAYLKTFDLSVDVIPDTIKMTILTILKYAGLTSKIIIAFSCEWPSFALEWISRNRPGMFPIPDMVQSIYSAGCHFVPYFSQPEYWEIIDDIRIESVGDAQTSWCLSFAVAERKLLKALSTEQRACFLIFREVVEEALTGYNMSSSVVKSIFLYACENIPTKDWQSKPGHCLLILLNNTSKAFDAGHLAHYFICTKNLLSGLSETVLRECASELQKCWSRPIAALNHALETLSIASSEIGPILDQIIVDVDDFVAGGNAKQSFIGCVYPCWGYLIQVILMNSEYTKALSALQEIQAEFENVFAKQINLEQVALSVLTGSNICKQWTFALFIDLRMGTNVSSALCDGREGIHISEVFGPKATELLKDTCIPQGANIEYGNLTYAGSVSQLLQELKRDDAFIAVLKYYLETYAVFAGVDIVLPVRDETARNEIIAACSTGMSKLVGSKEAVAEYQLSSALPMYLSNLHVDLFNKCMRIRKPDEYRSLLPTYQALAKLGVTETISRNATRMVQSLSAATSSETMFSEIMVSDLLDPNEEYGTDEVVQLKCTVM